MGLSTEIQSAIEELGFEQPTPVQEKTIPFLLENTQDVVALAQTGTGKTAAFGLPIIQQIDTEQKSIQALILSPTRELAMQISSDLKPLVVPLNREFSWNGHLYWRSGCGSWRWNRMRGRRGLGCSRVRAGRNLGW